MNKKAPSPTTTSQVTLGWARKENCLVIFSILPHSPGGRLAVALTFPRSRVFRRMLH